MDPILTIVVGATLLTVIAIEGGGAFLMALLGGSKRATPLQSSFFRAGHAHAGVLVLLGLTVLLVLQAAGVRGGLQWSGVGVLSSAILLPAGFFLSVLGRNREKPGPLVALIWIGAGVLALSLAVAGISVMGAGIARLG